MERFIVESCVRG